jgi:ribosomal protein S12 methylthiotransferase accessory factor
MSRLDRHDSLESFVDHVVDKRVGIVRDLYELSPEADAPQLFHYYSTACNTAQLGPFENFRHNGGAAMERHVAIAKAVGESVERYCCALVSPTELPVVSFEAAPFECVEPERFAFYTEAQFAEPNFEFVPFRRDTPVRWTPAVDCSTGRTVHLPAAAVWLPYYYVLESGEVPIMQPISTGLACHRGLARAILGGIGEVVERDSFTMMWQGRLSFPQIRVETLSERNYELVRRFERVGHEVHLLNITSDLRITVVLGVARHDRPGIPPIVFAASASADPEDAVRKALEELAHTRRYMVEIQGWGETFDPGERFENVVEQITHLRFWGDRDRARLADFATASDDRVDFRELPDLSRDDPEEELRAVRDRLEQSGFRCYVADVTTPDVGDLGISVVHCVIPGLHPFFIGHRRRARGCPRLYEAPQRFGFRPLAPGADNPLPHPYP